MCIELEGAAAVCADDLIDAVPELETAIIDRHHGVGQRHKLSVDKGDIRHVYLPRDEDESDTVT